MVDVPDVGFLFPAFNKRSADEDMTLFYTKDVSEFEDGLIDCLLDCAVRFLQSSRRKHLHHLLMRHLVKRLTLRL